jgi:hypothetical protein
MARRVDQSGLHVGDTVMYVGWQVQRNRGKLAKIVGIRDEYGFYLEYEDGRHGSATPEALKLVRRGSRDAVGLNDNHDACSTPRSSKHFTQARSSGVGAPSSRHIPPGEYLAMRPKVPCGENNTEQWTFCRPDAIDCDEEAALKSLSGRGRRLDAGDSNMTAEELLGIFQSAEYKKDLTELSSYLASIKQERPIVYGLAKFLWRRRQRFQLETKHTDLVINERKFEFKFHYDCDMEKLERELKDYGDALDHKWIEKRAWDRPGKNWSVSAGVCEHMFGKEPDVFVWIICSRDLRNVVADHICWAKEQIRWSATHPYADRTYLETADRFLKKLQSLRPFSILADEIKTAGDFPSVYHLRICDFSKTEISRGPSPTAA